MDSPHDAPTAPAPPIGIVGLGTMGLGIAQVFAQAGHRVLLTDASEAARASARERIAADLAPRVASGKLPAQQRDALLAAIEVADDLGALAEAHLTIEAIVERMEAKSDLLRSLEGVVAGDAVLATNTSSLPVGAIAARLRWPERLVGLHFFNPAPAMKLVELVAPDGASPKAVALARRLAEGAGKVVVDAPDRPGFIVNRCARPFYGEALALVDEGRSPAEVDAAMIAGGYRIGPFSLIDLIGADINLAATEGLSDAMGGHPRYHVFDRLRAQVASGDLGRKTGRGFVFPGAIGDPPADAATVALRIEAVLANEAGWLLAEGGATRDEIDRAMRLGLNFPRGPFEAVARHGADRVRAMLDALERRAPSELKGRYTVAPALAEGS